MFYIINIFYSFCSAYIVYIIYNNKQYNNRRKERKNYT